VQVWDFLENRFKQFREINPNCDKQISVSKCPFVKYKRFKGTKSRKGFLQTKWKVNDKEFDLLNIHLYHDDLNTIAVEKTPSVYSLKRAEALSETLLECDLCNERSAFLFGDFNVRLDGELIQWLKGSFLPTHSKEQTDDELLILHEKSFFFKYSEVFDQQSTISEMLQFDKEISRFNRENEVKLHEVAIKHGPSYCIDIDGVNNKSKKSFTKRIPAWCDRVLFTEASKKLLRRAEYNTIYGNKTMGDHTPVYLAFSLQSNQDSA